MRNNTFPDAPVPARTRLLDARLHLLDRQLVADGDPVGIVDDVEIGESSVEAPPQVTAILTGHVVATRIFGGKPPRSQLQSLPWRAVAKVGIVVELHNGSGSFENLWVERWLRDNVIARIPGGCHAAE